MNISRFLKINLFTLFIILNFLCCSCVADNDQYAIVNLSTGKIRGRVSYAAGPNRPANVFRGVPYAEPPVGKNRFDQPQKKKPWQGVLDTLEYKAACMTNSTRYPSPKVIENISEDCLHVNVFADPKCQKNSCPVLFYIHGGAFYHDAAIFFNDTEIVQKYASDGVIFVITAYRLGVFGFLDLGNDDTVRRNIGVYDMIFALKWTRNEIAAFGGDPKRITIMGNSAGGSAVAYLCASPYLAKDDFQQAIIASGVPAFRENQTRIQSLTILKNLNCLFDKRTNRTLSDSEKVDCMRSVSGLELLREQKRIEDSTDFYVFDGPGTDTHLLPAKNYAELVRASWQPRPLLIMTTKDEWKAQGYGESLDGMCHDAELQLGYTTSAVHQACLARHKNTLKLGENMLVASESIHAVALFIAQANHGQGKRARAPAYYSSFELVNYTHHAEDLFFFFGFRIETFQSNKHPDTKLMDVYFPDMIKRFLHGKAPDPDWKPVDLNGKGYFVLDFKVSNGKTITSPHFVDGYNDPDARKFWLKEMASLELRTKKKT